MPPQSYKEISTVFWFCVSASPSSHVNNLLSGNLADHTGIWKCTVIGVFLYELHFKLLFPWLKPLKLSKNFSLKCLVNIFKIRLHKTLVLTSIILVFMLFIPCNVLNLSKLLVRFHAVQFLSTFMILISFCVFCSPYFLP